MKHRNIKLLLIPIVLACTCFAACNMENPIMGKWWVNQEQEQSSPSEPDYIPILKFIPQVTYETIIQQEVVYDTIIEKLPPEIIYETIVQQEVIYETVIEKLPPEIIYQVITEYVETLVEIVKEPDLSDIINEIMKNDPDGIREIVKEIIKEIPVDLGRDIIKEIIKELPPQEIISYLTDEQIIYIIQQQPPEMILQNISIINIEYIIFSGDSETYNGDSPKGGTSLTASEKTANNNTVTAFAKALANNSDYLLILHGHANPITYDAAEIADLTRISENRAKAVEQVLKDKYFVLAGGAIEDERVSTSGYGGEKNLFGSSTTYAGLNRRVEMILIKVDTVKTR